MNKKLILIIVAVIVLGGGAFMLTSKKVESPANNGTSQSSEAAGVAVDACAVLTEAIAKQVLGAAAEKGTEPGGSSTDDISVSNCNYTATADTIANMKGAGLLVRAGKTKDGIDSNKSQFGSGAPAGSEKVEGLGDDANFNPSLGQLNVLKGGNWYIVSNYTGTNPTKATLEQVRKLADLLEFK